MSYNPFKNYRAIIIYILLIIVSTAGVIISININSLLIPFFAALLLFSVYLIIKSIKQLLYKVTFMFNCIECDDFTFKFTENIGDKYNKEFNKALNRIKQIMESTKRRTQERNEYFELLMNSVRTGIITINESGNVFHVNNYALKLLGKNILTHIVQLNSVSENLKKCLEEINPGEKRQFIITSERGKITLSINASFVNYEDKLLKVITLNDINNELDEREVESWIKLTRILSHEIMNSLAPITSLSETLLEVNKGSKDSNADITKGLTIIKQTSCNLEEFVKSYRKFTHIPQPICNYFNIKPFILHIADLIIPADIKYEINDTSDKVNLFADESLLTQVITNLLKNAVYEVSEIKEDVVKIFINIIKENDKIIIDIINIGEAIPQELTENIFTPFFTTKKAGSGIGLSISRQIMFRHGGSLILKSNKSGNVCFSLVFVSAKGI